MTRYPGSVTKMLLVLAGLSLAAAVLVVARSAAPYRVYVVRTDSMAPTIPPRSAVIVRVHEYELGQVITFHEAGVVMTHRFVARNADGTITTKGDDNNTIDPWHLQPSAVIGGVVAAPRMVGYWLFYIRSPLGLLSILVSCLAILQLWALGTRNTTRSEPLMPDSLTAARRSSQRDVAYRSGSASKALRQPAAQK